MKKQISFIIIWMIGLEFLFGTLQAQNASQTFALLFPTATGGGHPCPGNETITDIEKFNRQYAPIEVVESSLFHDRFLIIDETVYHIGASLKDLGKKLFAFSQMDVPVEWLEP